MTGVVKGAVGALQSRFSALFGGFGSEKDALSTSQSGSSSGSGSVGAPSAQTDPGDSKAKAVAAAVAERCGLRLQSGWSGEYESMLPAGATLFAAQQFMVEGGVSVACVGRVDNSAALGGVITEGDIVKAIARYSKNNDFLQQHAIAHMTTAQHVRTIPSNTSVGDALQLMLAGRFRHLPMLDSGSGRVMMNISVLQLSRQLLGVAALAQPSVAARAEGTTGAAKGALTSNTASDELEEDDGAAVTPFAAASATAGGGLASPASPPSPPKAAPSAVLSPTPGSSSHVAATSVVGGQSTSTGQGGHSAELTVAPEFHRRFASVHAALAQAAQLRAAGSHARVVATVAKALRNLSRLTASSRKAREGGGSLDVATALVACSATHVRALQMQAFAWKMLGLTGTDEAVASVGIAGVVSTSDALHAADSAVQDALEALRAYSDSVTQCMHFGASLTPGGSLLLLPAEEGGANATPQRAVGGASTATGTGHGVQVVLIAEHLDVFLSLMRAEICVFTSQYDTAAGLVTECLPAVHKRLPQHATATTALSRGHARQYIASIISDLVDEAQDVCEVASDATGGGALPSRPAPDTSALRSTGGGQCSLDPTAAQFHTPSAAQAAQAATACVHAAHRLLAACADWLPQAEGGGALCSKGGALQAPDAAMSQTAWQSAVQWGHALGGAGGGSVDAAGHALASLLDTLPRGSHAHKLHSSGTPASTTATQLMCQEGQSLPCLASSWRCAQNSAALSMQEPEAFAGAALLAGLAAVVCAAAGDSCRGAAAVWRMRAVSSAAAGLHACAVRTGGLHGAAEGTGEENSAESAGKWAELLRAVQQTVLALSSSAAGDNVGDSGAQQTAAGDNGDEASPPVDAKSSAQADLDELAALLAAHGD